MMQEQLMLPPSFCIIVLTSYSDMLGIMILSEGNVPASDHTHEVPAGDQALVRQGQLAG